MGANHHRLDVAVPQKLLYRQEAGRRCVGVTLAARRGSGIFVGRDASILTAGRLGGGYLGRGNRRIGQDRRMESRGRIRSNGRIFSGGASATDIVEAAIKAYLPDIKRRVAADVKSGKKGAAKQTRPAPISSP